MRTSFLLLALAWPLGGCIGPRCDSILDCDLYTEMCVEGACVPIPRCDADAECADDEYCVLSARVCGSADRCGPGDTCESPRIVCGTPQSCQERAYQCDTTRDVCVPVHR